MNRKRFCEFYRFAEAWALLHFAKLFIIYLPFKKIMPLLGETKKQMNEANCSLDTLSSVSQAIRWSSRYTIHRSKCFDQALTAKWMLKTRKIPSVIIFGVAKEGDAALSAHAWVTVGNEVIVGKETFEKFTPLLWFGN